MVELNGRRDLLDIPGQDEGAVTEIGSLQA